MSTRTVKPLRIALLRLIPAPWPGPGKTSGAATALIIPTASFYARVIVDSWMTSPGHRANLLNPDYTHLGVGVSLLGKEIRATQNFVQRR